MRTTNKLKIKKKDQESDISQQLEFMIHEVILLDQRRLRHPNFPPLREDRQVPSLGSRRAWITDAPLFSVSRYLLHVPVGKEEKYR